MVNSEQRPEATTFKILECSLAAQHLLAGPEPKWLELWVWAVFEGRVSGLGSIEFRFR